MFKGMSGTPVTDSLPANQTIGKKKQQFARL